MSYLGDWKEAEEGQRRAEHAQKYPEHHKLEQVRARSQAIGEFLDFTLPRLWEGMCIYERIRRDCECSSCQGGRAGRMHTEEELATGIPVQVEEWVPTRHSIHDILAAAFGIDQEALEREKRSILEELRAA